MAAPTRDQARKAVQAAWFVLVLGGFGLMVGFQEPPAFEVDPSLPEGVRAQAFLAFTALDAGFGAQLRIVDAVVSGMLVVGGWMLLGRAKSAMWWLKQAFIANFVWLAVHAVDRFVVFRALFASPEHVQRLAARVEVAEFEMTQASIVVGILQAGAVGMSLAVHVAAAFAVFRPSVRAFAESDRELPPTDEAEG